MAKRRFFFDSSEDHDISKIEFERRNVEIKDTDGRTIYFGKNLEFPKCWSEKAKRIVASKFFYRGGEGQDSENSLKQLVYRVSDSLEKEAIRQGVLSEKDAANFKKELSYMEFMQMHSFNSPVWFNVGLYDKYKISEDKKDKKGISSHWAVNENGNPTNRIDAYQRPQGSACFIQSIEDNMGSILEHAKKEGMLFKYGSGTGTNFSTLRGTNEPLSGGGVASGEMSFMRIYDIIAGRIRSGGKTRRAAKMVITDVNHPDIFRFILWKVNEEKKALWLSVNPSWAPHNPGDLDSEAYKTVDGQNGNNSVRVSDEFMNFALNGGDLSLYFKTGHRTKKEQEIPIEKYKDDRYLPDMRFIKKLTNRKKVVSAKQVLEQIARAATVVGDPALQYHDTINSWHTCPNSGPINASNPCSEYMFLDDTACNLASLNLLKFTTPNEILNISEFKKAVQTSIVAQEIMVDYASYPSKKIAKNSSLFRPLGLGYTNLGALLMSRGIAYDSDEGRAIAAAVTSLMTATAYRTSAELARKLGAFKEFEKNKKPMLDILKKHRDFSLSIPSHGSEKIRGLNELINEANKNWDEAIKIGKRYGFRNAQVTLLAPTGTIGFMMDVDCTGIEPLTGLVTIKSLVGGGKLTTDVPFSVFEGLRNLGYEKGGLEKIVEYIRENGTVIGAPELKEEHYNVFATAAGNENTINIYGHLKMMAAVQPFLSGAISKTVNLPKGSSVKDVKDTYILGWRLGLKSVSLYIDGSKGIQPITIHQKEKEKNEVKWGERKKPNSIDMYRKNVTINGVGLHFKVGEYNDSPPKDSPADFFVEFGSSGSEYSAVYDSWAKELSRNRQRGASL